MSIQKLPLELTTIVFDQLAPDDLINLLSIPQYSRKVVEYLDYKNIHRVNSKDDIICDIYKYYGSTKKLQQRQFYLILKKIGRGGQFSTSINHTQNIFNILSPVGNVELNPKTLNLLTKFPSIITNMTATDKINLIKYGNVNWFCSKTPISATFLCNFDNTLASSDFTVKSMNTSLTIFDKFKNLSCIKISVPEQKFKKSVSSLNVQITSCLNFIKNKKQLENLFDMCVPKFEILDGDETHDIQIFRHLDLKDEPYLQLDMPEYDY